MSDYFIGLMSGTSMDALDAVLVDFSNPHPQLIAHYSHPLDEALRQDILNLAQPGDNELDRLAQLDVSLGKLSAKVCLQLLKSAGVSDKEIKAIGSHGQTIRHNPNASTPYTVQISDPNTIAQLSGITTVADFRRRDMVVGGQGAPLVPAFHRALFHTPGKNRVILNLGGIANISVLPADNTLPVRGFDTGPANMLMDAWTQLHRQQAYDTDGTWAQSGQVDAELLQRLLRDPYLSQPPPKSTGRERYNLAWLRTKLSKELPTQDVQATLCELTVSSIANVITQFAGETDEIYVCGGGAKNHYLMERLHAQLDTCYLSTTEDLGVDPQWVEAMAFAWLARQTLHQLPGNLPAVTGARESVLLGAIYPAPPHH